MTIRYQCTECDSVLKIRDDKAGGQGRCPKCKTEFLIPEPNTGDDAGQESSVPPATINRTGDDEEDALAFLLDGGEAPPTPAAASTSLDSDDEPPPSRPDPAERQLRRPTTKPQASAADTASAAGDLLSQTESARAAAARDHSSEEPSRVNLDGIKQVASRQVPLVGGILAVSLICYGAYVWGSGWVGSSDAPPLSGVTGTVTLDGKPLPLALVVFQPDLDMQKGEGTTVSASMGRTNDKGNYTLTYPGAQGLEGAVVGVHIIRINKTDVKTGLEVLPKKYHRQTELKREVKTGSNTIDLELTSDKDGSARPLPNLRTGTR